ncbi:MAG: hypothetical protein U9M89_00765 [Patescibacteria group bacterium]|nr:hypothetical protein [Patescibacteria group bacterium]
MKKRLPGAIIGEVVVLVAMAFCSVCAAVVAVGVGNREEAHDIFEKAYSMYLLFWGFNIGAITTDGGKKIDEDAIGKKDTEKKGFVGKLGALIKKPLDCCLE